MSVTNAIRFMQHHCPKAWKLINPKRFRGVERFGDYRRLYLYLADIASFTRTGETTVDQLTTELRTNPDIVSYLDAYLTQQLAADVPLFFVQSELLDAVNRSDINFVVDWLAMPLPFQSFTFILPPNENGFDCICVTRVSASEAGLAGFGNRQRPFDPPGEMLFAVQAFTQSGTDYQARMVEPYNPETFHQVLEGLEPRRVMVRIAFNLIFAMAARPEYVELGRRKGIHKKSGSQLWTPNILGRKYAAKRDPETETGTHASPRMHWRRGHFRQQPFGTGRTEHKIIWIEPMLVNAKVVDAR